MAIGWGPVILGISRSDLQKSLEASLSAAKASDVPDADIAMVSIHDGVKVEFENLDETAAKALWAHLEKKLKENLPHDATIKV